PALDDVEPTAVSACLDLSAARARTEAAADRLGDESLHAWLPELGIGVSAIDRDSTWEVGPAVRVGLPIFDHNSGPRARARAELARADHELAATATELRARSRAARIAALAAYAEAHHLHDVVLPLRQQI